jgi:hypothetical protein
MGKSMITDITMKFLTQITCSQIFLYKNLVPIGSPFFSAKGIGKVKFECVMCRIF